MTQRMGRRRVHTSRPRSQGKSVALRVGFAMLFSTAIFGYSLSHAVAGDEVESAAASSRYLEKGSAWSEPTVTRVMEPLPAGPQPAPAPIPATCTRTVRPDQGDLATAMGMLKPGDVLCLRDGTYRQDVNRRLPKGKPTARITVRSYPGERAVIHGYTTIVGADHWTLSDLEFTNPGTTDPIVRLLGGTGWIFERNEVHDGDYAGVLVGRSSTEGPPHDYIMRYNAIHDTRASNLYHNPSRHSTGGLIERNLFFNSKDAQNVKLGWGGTEVCTGSNYENFGIGEVTVRYNTLYNAYQPLTIAESGGDRRVEVHHNLIGLGTRGFLVRIDNVEGCLGDNVWVHHNAGFDADHFAEDFSRHPTVMEKMTDNVLGSHPQFDSTTKDGFRPRAAERQIYGRYATG